MDNNKGTVLISANYAKTMKLISLLFTTLAVLVVIAPVAYAAEAINIGDRRELFVDHYLIDIMQDAQLTLHHPRDEGAVLKFDKPWEGLFCIYSTVIKDGSKFRLFYRGMPATGHNKGNEVSCIAESEDGIHWEKPEVGIYEIHGSKKNNVILADHRACHNLSPFIDTNPDAKKSERYKAMGGTGKPGLIALTSADGIHWKELQKEPVLTKGAFDSQNVVFWSETEKQYLCYFRVFSGGVRRISRSTSQDFVHWSEPVMMEYRHHGGEAPIEHLYTSQTHPYFRAPHIYISTAARFMPGRQVLSEEQAKAINVNPGYFKDTSDSILQSTRGDGFYDRTFLSSFIPPGIGASNWVSRTNYPALNVVQTSPTEMSVYVNADYAQPTAYLRRYSLRLDGFASLRADYGGGGFVTKPLVFSGKQLEINFSTSAAGGLRVEIQDQDGKALPGFALDDCREQIGNEITRVVSWKGGSHVSSIEGKPVRLRFLMKDADLYALKFSK